MSMAKCCGTCKLFIIRDGLYDSCGVARPEKPKDWPSSAIVMIASVTSADGKNCPCYQEKD
jgi:hypothetical protein